MAVVRSLEEAMADGRVWDSSDEHGGGVRAERGMDRRIRV
jgi:hypothetical protein